MRHAHYFADPLKGAVGDVVGAGVALLDTVRTIVGSPASSRTTLTQRA